VVSVRVSVLDDPKPGRARLDRPGDARVEPGRHHREDERDIVPGGEPQELIERRRRGARVVVPPPDSGAARRPRVELRVQALPGRALAEVGHG
jgi:hypothetical protein